jgi:hypothetical protein
MSFVVKYLNILIMLLFFSFVCDKVFAVGRDIGCAVGAIGAVGGDIGCAVGGAIVAKTVCLFSLPNFKIGFLIFVLGWQFMIATSC